MKLEKPELKHYSEYIKMIEEWDVNEIVPIAMYLNGLTYEEFLARRELFSLEETVPANYVPDSLYFLVNNDKILGAINIRHRLNDYLAAVGGNIGYGITPSCRGNGYASKMLSLALEKCLELQINQVLIVCDKTNIASAKTILSCGGILENEVTEDDGNVIQRYYIYL